MTWTLGQLVTTAAGTTIAYPDGQVMSLNPSDTRPPYGPYYFTARPAGTAGPYELCVVSGNMVNYNPTGQQPVVFGFMPSAANSPGLCAISSAPLA